jgi:hypothetical protein
MNVVRLCGNSLSDIYAVLAQDDWATGYPQGLAHWDGANWTWVRRIEKSFAQTIIVHKGLLYILDFGGQIHSLDANKNWNSIQLPVFGCQNLWISDTGEMVVVGVNGACCTYRNNLWEIAQTGIKNDLYSISGNPPDNFIVGGNGRLLRYDGSSFYKIKTEVRADLTQIDMGVDGSLFASGTLLSIYKKDRTWKTSILDTTPLFSIAVITSQELYASSASGVLLWDGSRFSNLLPDTAGVAQLTKVGGIVVGGAPNTLYYGPPNWKKLPITLNESFLDY